MIALLEKLQTDVWRTAGARYNAARRLRRRESFATVSLALMSSATVAVAFIQRVYASPSSPADNYLTVVSGALGVLLLTVSLIEWGARTGAMAEALYQNAEKLNSFRRRIELTIASEKQTASSNQRDLVKNLADEYEIIKTDCLHNHIPLDDDYFRLQHKNAPEFSKHAVPCSTWCRWQIASVWYITGLWLFLIFLISPLMTGDMWKGPSSTSANSAPMNPQAQSSQRNSPNIEARE